MRATKRGPQRRIVPPNFVDPSGLALRILRSRDPAALFAVASTLAALPATPLDLLLQFAERRLYRRAAEPTMPIIFVTGPPRSGTTVVYQALSEHLPVTYFNNLTVLFPRSPIVGNLLFGRFLRKPRPQYRSFYGRTSGLGRQNDALHLWDRWMGPDRYAVPTSFDASTAESMVRFFAAYEAAFGRPIINKNNALATCASLIARTLRTSHFIYVRRDAASTVRSILGARETIQGIKDAPYGVGDPERSRSSRGSTDFIEDVCAQVLYHERRMEEQRSEIGDRRFWIVDYETFCREPHRIVERAAREILGTSVDGPTLRAGLPSFDNRNLVARPSAEFDEIRATLARLRAGSMRQQSHS